MILAERRANLHSCRRISDRTHSTTDFFQEDQ